jgi:hypothetical protein
MIFFDVMYFDYVYMCKVLYYVKFAVNEMHFVFGFNAFFIEDFNCDFLVGGFVYSKSDLTEVTSANCVLEIVVAEFWIAYT